MRAPLATYPVVRLEIVHLFPEHQRPEVLADELDHVKRVVEARPVAGKPASHKCQLARGPYIDPK